MGQYTAAVHNRLMLPARALLSSGQEQRVRLAGGAVPAAVLVQLLIDTGPGRSTLVPSIIAQLRPASQGVVRVETSIGSAETPLFWIRLEFPDTNLAPVSEFAVARLALPSSLAGFHGLIGRDLLSRWEHLLYQGRRGRFTIRDMPRSIFAWPWG
jgi:hypothetical protein